jgi:hypothetical protein
MRHRLLQPTFGGSALVPSDWGKTAPGSRQAVASAADSDVSRAASLPRTRAVAPQILCSPRGAILHRLRESSEGRRPSRAASA